MEFRRSVIKLAAQITGLIVVLVAVLGVMIFLLVSANQSGIPVAVAGVDERREELQRLLSALVIAGSGSTLAAAAIGAWLAARAMRPMAQALALQRRFVADASHELRTPLTLLSTRVQMLRRKLPSAESPSADRSVIRGMDELVEDARTLTEILEDLLIAADPRETAERSLVELGSVTDQTLLSLRSAAEERGLILRRDGASDPVTINGANIAIRRLITALVSNALDHARSTVVVEISHDRATAIIRVSDDGPGFRGPANAMLGRFSSSRVDHTDQSATRHYGLGLALVADVAARHGGTVVIEDPDPTRPGAVVAVRIPAAR